jgi:high-affinity iron transporter
VVGSFALWFAAETFLTVTTLQRELLEGITALLAAAVLVYVTHWIFHKTYVVQWVQFVREQVERSVDKGHMAAVGLVSFFVIFREGFETVLFYQAMLLESPPAWVLGGFVAGVAATGLIAWLLLKLGRRLPINRFFVATGALLMLLALVFTGFGIRGLQTAGLVSATPVPGFPELPFLQLYLGLFPTWETLLAQAALVLLFVGGWVWIHVAARKNTPPEALAGES